MNGKDQEETKSVNAFDFDASQKEYAAANPTDHLSRLPFPSVSL